MFSKPHNQNLLDDVMKILGGGDKPENNIKPAPQWVVDASHGAAKTLSEAYGSGQVVTSELKRDILRKHLAEAVKDCGCNVNKEDPIYFEKEVEKRMNEGVSNRPETNKQIEEAMHRSDAEAILAGKIPEKYKGANKASLVATAKSAIAKTDKNRAAFAADKAKRAAQKEQIAVDMRDFLAHLTEEEVDVLTDVVIEATMSKGQLKKAVNDAFYKHFNKVQIDMMSIPKLYKEIEAGLTAGKSPDEFVPALVSKYRKN